LGKLFKKTSHHFILYWILSKTPNSELPFCRVAVLLLVGSFKTKEYVLIPPYTMSNNRKFNNYKFTPNEDKDLYTFLRDGISPVDDNLTRRKQYEKKYEGFAINEKDGIVYLPTQQVVVPSDLKTKFIQQIYKEFGLGSGVDSLYEKVSRRYLGITRADIKDFLRNQESYQLGFPIQKQTQKKVFVSGVNKVWYADLIDLNPFIKSNKKYRYILSITDGYSRFVMLYRLKHKEALDIYNAFEEAFKEYGTPSAINTDLGTEFHNEVVSSLFQKIKVKHLSGESYNPKANALAEASNGFIRQVLKQLFLQKGNTIWYNDLD
jgi:hypothetical protein